VFLACRASVLGLITAIIAIQTDIKPFAEMPAVLAAIEPMTIGFYRVLAVFINEGSDALVFCI
jgi:hypothetical protein